MNSKERVLTAINHEEPDKVPIDSWMPPEVTNELVKVLNVDLSKDRFELAKILGHDLLYAHVGLCDSFSTCYREDRKIGENLYQDVFGIKWRKKSQRYGSYCEMAEHPLADMKKYDEYNWPDPMKAEEDNLKMYKELVAGCGKDYAIVGAVACTIFEGSWYLRGLESFMTDLYKNRDFANEILDKVMNYHLVIAKEFAKMGVDIVWIGDDIACERGPYIAPEMYREMLKPRHAYMIQEVRKINKNIKIAYHTDGDVGWALDDLIEIGIDILNPLQPDVNNVAEIKRKYGKKLTFWGNVDTRHVMAEGTVSDVIEEVKNVIKTLAPGGGLLLNTNHAIQASPRAVENTITYYWAAEKFRNYPIHIEKVDKIKKADWFV